MAQKKAWRFLVCGQLEKERQTVHRGREGLRLSSKESRYRMQGATQGAHREQRPSGPGVPPCPVKMADSSPVLNTKML